MELDQRAKKRVLVNILGVNYPILTDEDDETMQQIEQLLSELVQSIKDENPKINNTTAMVLACLNLSEELYRIKAELERYKDMAKEYSVLSEYRTKLKQAMMETEQNEAKLTALLAKCERLDNENDELRDLIEEYEEKFSELRNENELNKRTITDLQNKLVENQIELVKTRKSFLDLED